MDFTFKEKTKGNKDIKPVGNFRVYDLCSLISVSVTQNTLNKFPNFTTNTL